MAAAQGGNVAGSVADEIVVTANGVSIIGYTDLPGRLPAQASQLYGTNLVNLLKLLTPGKDGALVLDLDDVVQRGMTVVRAGEKTWPPPPVQVSAAPAPAAAVATRQPAPPTEPPPPGRRFALVGLGAALLFLLPGFSPSELVQHLTVFALAVVVGFYVIGGVHHALHTPLMRVTNAISGIIVVGALLQIGHDDALVTALAFVAILVASINVFGGFAVTRRMLGMFTRGPSTKCSPMTATSAAVRGLHRRRAAVHPQPRRPVQARDGQDRQRLRHRRHGHRAGRHHRPGRPEPLRHRRRPDGRRRGHRRRHRPVAGRGGSR